MQYKPSSATAISNHRGINYKPFHEIGTRHEKDRLRGYTMKILNMICVPSRRLDWCYWQLIRDPAWWAHELRRPLTTGLQSVQHLSLTPASTLTLAFSLCLSLFTPFCQLGRLAPGLTMGCYIPQQTPWLRCTSAVSRANSAKAVEDNNLIFNWSTLLLFC